MYDKTVGIYMPTFNRVELLKKAVDSVIAQTYKNFKLIIVDDGSTDETPNYLKSIDDPRISYLRHDISNGACKARNAAIALLDTELITGLDDDDKFMPDRLKILVGCYSDKYSFVCSGYYWNYGFYKKVLFGRNKNITLSDACNLNHCSNQILVKRQRLLSVGGFDESMPALQDYDLWIRLIAKYGNAFRVKDPLYIVNSDRSFQHISSSENLLKAMVLFEQKHRCLMLHKHKQNFDFYRLKLNGSKFGLFDLIGSVRHGLVVVKLKLYLSQSFKYISILRLRYLQTGSFLSKK
jgi:glycosyltransferase involved in cell wall biosynthesis